MNFNVGEPWDIPADSKIKMEHKILRFYGTNEKIEFWRIDCDDSEIHETIKAFIEKLAHNSTQICGIR